MMVVVPAVLLVLALTVGLIPGVVPAIEQGAARFTNHAAYATWVLQGRAVSWPAVAASHVSGADVIYGVISTLGALALGALGLFGRPLRAALPGALTGPAVRGLHALRALHSGHIGDYIAWWTAGASVLGALFLLALT